MQIVFYHDRCVTSTSIKLHVTSVWLFHLFHNLNKLVHNLSMEINIWKIRNERGLSLDDMQALTGINRSRINRIEQANNKHIPNIVELEKIAKALNLKIVDLFESEYKM